MTDETPELPTPTDLDSWKFYRSAPTPQEVLKLLGELPLVFGVATLSFADYVQALPQKEKIKVPVPERPNLMRDEHVDVWTLYMSVAGRVKMLQAAQDLHGWRVDFRPEKHTPTGVPGFLSLEGKLQYREYCVIWDRMTDGTVQKLGSRPGTSGRIGGTPSGIEKVETAARGRSIAAWGFGVLPGSGIASLEEMLNLGGDREQASWEADVAPADAGEKATRENALSEILTKMEEVAQLSGQPPEAITLQVREYLVDRLGVQEAWDEEGQRIVWDLVSPKRRSLVLNGLRSRVATLQGGQPL